MDQLYLMGRELGAYTGWDVVDAASYIYYGFVPRPYITNLPSGDLMFDTYTGLFRFVDGNGKTTHEVDAATVLSSIERSTVPGKS